METITLKAGGYEAMFWPQRGGACISLKKDGQEILHHFDKKEEILALPVLYGLPFLFPPNRLDHGQFTFEGRTCRFDINEPAYDVCCHGPLYLMPWQVGGYTEDEEYAEIHLVFENVPGSDFYENNWPFAFEAEQVYTLDAKGLHQEAHITNLDTVRIPLGLGWHSAYAIEKGDRIWVSVGKRVQLNDRMLPTGELTDLSDEELRYRTEGQDPLFRVQDDHYTAQPLVIDGQEFHGVIIRHDASRTELVVRVDEFYKHWMICNAGCEGSFICIEPQNWRVNAPNLPIPAEESGMDWVEPDETMIIRADICLNKY